MNFHLKRHRKLSEVIPVPEGLPELMADISREVLRYQPGKIEEFIADYLEAMVLTRELYYVSERTVDEILDQSVHLKEMMTRTGVTATQSNSAIQMIVDSVKHHRTFVQNRDHIKELDIVNRLIKELNFSVEQAKKASEIIENVWCHYFNQNKNYVLKFKANITENEAVQHTLTLHRRSDVSIKEVKLLKDYFKHKTPLDDFDEKHQKMNWKSPNFENREKAAIKIQSWYRSAKIRKDNQELNSAAAKIQAIFRGYKTRKELHGQEEAAKNIQAHYRGYSTRKKLKDPQ